MDLAFSGKTAIVTGASSGIGRATAFKLAESGAAVAVLAHRKDLLDEMVSQIAGKGGKALGVAGDASVAKDIDSFLDQALAWQEGGRKIDIAVVNAGRGLAGGILDSDESQWRQVYEINVLGTAHLLRAAALYMSRRKTGDIVAIGSVVGRTYRPSAIFTGRAKFAVAGIIEGLRREVCSTACAFPW